MRHPAFIVASDNEAYRAEIKGSITAYQRTHFPGINFHMARSMREHTPGDADVAFIDYTSDKKLQRVIEGLARFRGSHPSTSIILVNFDSNPYVELGELATLSKLGISSWITRPTDSPRVSSVSDQVASKLDDLVDNGQIKTKIRIGAVGGGNFFHGLLASLPYSPWVSYVNVFAGSTKECGGTSQDYSRANIIKSVGLEACVADGRVTFSNSPEEWGSVKYDLVILATGLHITDYNIGFRSGGEKAKQLEIDLFKGAVPKLARVTPMLKSFKGALFDLCNPPELTSHFIVRETGMDPRRIVSPTPEGRRLSNILYEMIVRSNPECAESMGRNPERNIAIRLFGIHSDPIPDFDSSGVWTKSFDELGNKRDSLVNISEVLSQLKNEDIREDLRLRLKQWGPKTMISARALGRGYFEVPQVVATAVQRMAHFQEPYPSATYSIWDDSEGVFSQHPSVYNPEDSTFTKIEGDIINPALRARISAQITEQKELVKELVKELMG